MILLLNRYNGQCIFISLLPAPVRLAMLRTDTSSVVQSTGMQFVTYRTLETFGQNVQNVHGSGRASFLGADLSSTVHIATGVRPWELILAPAC